MEDASCSKVGHVNTVDCAKIGKRESSNHIHPNGLLTMCLTPVDIWTAGQACCVHHVSAATVEQLTLHTLPVLQAGRSPFPGEALLSEQISNHAANPAGPSENQELDLLGLLRGGLSMTGALLIRNAWGLQPWNGHRVCHQDRVHVTVGPERLAMDSETNLLSASSPHQT